MCVSFVFIQNTTGTPLGEKTIEIAHKVATDTAEELKKAAASYEGQDLPGTVISYLKQSFDYSDMARTYRPIRSLSPLQILSGYERRLCQLLPRPHLSLSPLPLLHPSHHPL